MKSGTEIMLHAQVKEAGDAHLALLAASETLLQRYLDLANSGDCGFWNPEEEDEVKAMREAIARCTSWYSTLPQPEKPR